MNILLVHLCEGPEPEGWGGQVLQEEAEDHLHTIQVVTGHNKEEIQEIQECNGNFLNACFTKGPGYLVISGSHPSEPPAPPTPPALTTW